ncbi:(2Fe-2S)-binding protein [bacterium]|nr:(2Fe-2S)-binding protein [bacterium]
MIRFSLNGLEVKAATGSTILEVSKNMGFPIPTLCNLEGLSSMGACRLCVVEIENYNQTRLVTACTYPVTEGLTVRTASTRVIRARRMIIELLLASAPQSKRIQDLAAAYNVRQQRFRQEYENCILCGLCVRMCKEQMAAGAIGFQGRGQTRSIGVPFNRKSEQCRLCGGCLYVCPICELRCTYTEPEKAVCGGCANISPPCLENLGFDDMMCYMEPCVACEIKKE